MYEKRVHPLLSRRLFGQRAVRHTVAGLSILFVSTLGGMAGYWYFEGYSWQRAFLNAAMISGAMGPVGEPETDAGKVFAGIYGLYSGLAFVFVAGVVAAPWIHRLLHHFHQREGE